MGFLLSAVTVAEVFTWIGYFIIALLCLMVIIVIHETGHYLAGKALGFKIDEFSIGFGPAIIKYTNKKNGELFAVRCIPLGGYCGFHGETEETEADDPTIFTAQKPWKRLIVFVAGAMFNLFSAVLLISIFFMAYGDFVPRIGNVYEYTDGHTQQFQQGDVILKVNGEMLYSLVNPTDYANKLNAHDGDIKVLVRRGEEEIELTVSKHKYIPIDAESGESLQEQTGFGISVNGYEREKYGFFTAFGKAFIFCFKIIGLIFSTLGSLFTGAIGIKETLGGTGTAIYAMMQLSRGGFETIMYGLCVLSASIGVMNLMPLPALDGSHVVFTGIEWVRGKPINRKVENLIHFIGLIVLFGLAILLDILHFTG